MNTLYPLCFAGAIATWAFLRTLAGERDRRGQEAEAIAKAAQDAKDALPKHAKH